VLIERFNSNLLSGIMEHRLTPRQVYTCVFQVLFALMVLQAGHAGARHNDLHCANVFVKQTPTCLLKADDGQATKIRYTWGSACWTWDTFVAFAAVGDFDFADLGSGCHRNVKLTSQDYSKDFNINTCTDTSYDAYTFLHSICIVIRKYQELFPMKVDLHWRQLEEFCERPFGCAADALPNRPQHHWPTLVPHKLLPTMYPPSLYHPGGVTTPLLYHFGMPSGVLPCKTMLQQCDTPLLMELARSVGIIDKHNRASLLRALAKLNS
jgi:hypothetical protein